MTNEDVVYYDSKRKKFYTVRWEDGGNNDIAHRTYINTPESRKPLKGNN
jgi:hypothetical protein